MKTKQITPPQLPSGVIISFETKDDGCEHEIISKRSSMHASHGDRPKTDLYAIQARERKKGKNVGYPLRKPAKVCN
jgi:hypothetical protein